ncbi:39S ribosomal protein L41, mitochondrial [Dufourea novaeangliae]|uniref:39S ribosomal protein L41, mitochondrial n=2 Tax=Dufourea novaeangliae TaxID=178035 RepID=A0A154PC37_DUFNO|nr:39S ribosomal protein L41, mitochondrial [Dufourea novaeangliae]
MYNKRGNRQFRERQSTDPNFPIPIDRRGVRLTGEQIGDDWVDIPEKIPEIIVPSLKDFHLKPYVSYRVEEITVREFTAKDLFNYIYAAKIVDDFEKNRLGPDGTPLYPNEYEELTPEEARIRAEQTGTDIFALNEEGF